VLAAGGLVLAARERRFGLLAPPAACGAVLGASYLLFLGYAAPRFLIPAYALLALPVAELLTAVAAFGRSRWRIATLGLVATGLAFLAIGQQVVLARMVAFKNTSRQDHVAIATRLHDLGLRPPCTLSGQHWRIFMPARPAAAPRG
jgi:hypothetical protein